MYAFGLYLSGCRNHFIVLFRMDLILTMLKNSGRVNIVSIINLLAIQLHTDGMIMHFLSTNVVEFKLEILL